MTTATVGSRYQIVIPRCERERVGLRPAEKVQVHAENGCLVVVPPRKRGWRGIGKALADGSDATDYIRRLRSEWEKMA